MEPHDGVQVTWESDDTIVLESDNDEQMDVDDLTPDFITIPVRNPYSRIISNNYQEEEAAALSEVHLEIERILTRNSSPVSLIANVGSPSLSTVSEDTTDNVPQVALPTDNAISDEERSRSPILNTTIHIENISSPQSTHAKAPEEEPSCSNTNQHQEDEGTTCPICFDTWTNLGEHRMCALKCGHLFGLSCISRWISTLKNKVCPTCKKKATKSDIRFIYARKLVAVDDNDVEIIKQQIADTLKETQKLQIELTKSVCRERLLGNRVQELQNTIKNLSSELETNHVSGNKSTANIVKMYKEKSLELCKAKGCRVLSYYKKNDLIVASTKSSNVLFPGFGARKIDLSTFRPTSYIPLHLAPIRDMRFHSEQPWLLSVSLDKSFKIVDTNSNATIATQNGNNLPLWSCCWDTNDTNVFYVGEQQGSVVKFDIRQANQAVDTYTVPGDNSPVVSIATMTESYNNPLEGGGIISCKLNSLWVFGNKASNECSRHFLPIDPPFICMTYDNMTPRMLVSTRPTSTVSYTRHHVANLVLNESNNIIADVSHCLRGSATSKLLSRSCFLSHQGCSYAAAYQESDNMVNLWSTANGEKITTVPAHNAVLDLCGINSADSTYLLSLTDSKIDFYKFQ